MELSVNSMLKWLVTTEPHLIPSPSSKLPSSERKTRLEGPDLTNSEELSSFLSFELLQELATKNTAPSSELLDLTPSVNDLITIFNHHLLHSSINNLDKEE